jgi:hypothetical protein
VFDAPCKTDMSWYFLLSLPRACVGRTTSTGTRRRRWHRRLYQGNQKRKHKTNKKWGKTKKGHSENWTQDLSNHTTRPNCKESDLRIGKPIQSTPWSGAPVVYGSGSPLAQRHNKRGQAGAREQKFAVPTVLPQTLTTKTDQRGAEARGLTHLASDTRPPTVASRLRPSPTPCLHPLQLKVYPRNH